ncbi:response regulator transcription factor [Jiulongibacter sediminis]|jgi:DNA-binding response OmpR family regulator|uniref:Transcriptional regulator n=1 Tax=Jiulongibacter sediminis TaxID=1605367 RepID=A0A0P7C755_9BACT|nr:response regulator transcription factor [Jiulongibacter sediminis]KPM48211.1 transcriptional regulator [Jiulongibacter sediminis]TBX24755.1 transcriptional regulator [Jiulongibacter sediminis]
MKIYVFEDEALLLKSLEFRLSKEGYDVNCFSNGLEAKQKLQEELPDLIITDIMMPFLNGLELISFVRNDLKSQVPIIVLSAAGLEKTVLEAFNLGADDFVSKPFSPNELLIRIKKMSHRIKISVM